MHRYTQHCTHSMHTDRTTAFLLLTLFSEQCVVSNNVRYLVWSLFWFDMPSVCIICKYSLSNDTALNCISRLTLLYTIQATGLKICQQFMYVCDVYVVAQKRSKTAHRSKQKPKTIRAVRKKTLPYSIGSNKRK